MADDKLDMDDRDTNDINDHLQVAFEDVIAEPDGAHSNDCVWRCSYGCFNGAKLCCYRFLTLLCGCCTAFCWGCDFACITFCHIWQVTPALKLLSINCGAMQKCWGTCLECFLAPVCETCSLCFSKVKVTNS